MPGVLKILLIFFGIYYGFRLLFRYVVPFLLARFVRRAQQNFMDQFQQQAQAQSGPQHDFKEGEVTIEQKKPQPNKPKFKDEGDYVDFEEIKD